MRAQLIGGMSKRLATVVQFLKETGCRKGEMWDVKWVDIDSERNVVQINSPEKNSRPRKVRISPRLVSLINQLPRICEYVFRKSQYSSPHSNLSYYWQKRREIAQKVNNPNLMRIDFKCLRHFKATREYFKTKDILFVKELLGHKSIKNTLIYVHLTEFARAPASTLTPHKIHVDEFPIEVGFMNSFMSSSTVKLLFLASSPTFNAVSFLIVREY